jgi:hypothetical protein
MEAFMAVQQNKKPDHVVACVARMTRWTDQHSPLTKHQVKLDDGIMSAPTVFTGVKKSLTSATTTDFPDGCSRWTIASAAALGDRARSVSVQMAGGRNSTSTQPL